MIDIGKLDKETNHDYAIRIIKNNIINLELKPGTLLSEQDIANELKLSRTPVHEAFQELAKTKIIEVIPQRGNLVSLIDMKIVEESVFIRETIETAILKEMCDQITDEEIQKLEEVEQLMEFYSSKNNIAKILEYDNQFHYLMYEITDRVLSYEAVKMMSIHFNRFRTLSLLASGYKNIIEGHRKIIDAVKAKDKDTAVNEYLAHLNRRFIDEKEIRSKYTEYFSN